MDYTVELKVKSLIEEKKITQKRLAEISGLRESTISDIVRGTRTVINFEHLSKIAEALDIQDISQLIDFVDEHSDIAASWEKDVFECIKTISRQYFSLQDVYGFMNEMQEKNPDNHNVDAKNRQTLQALRKKGIIDFIDNNGQYKLL